MTNDFENIITEWVKTPTAKEPAQAMIALVKADSLHMSSLMRGVLSANWHKTSHAAKWARLFTDAALCAGFHHSDGWWLGQLSKLPQTGDIRTLPLLVAAEAVKYVESEWRPEWPLLDNIQTTMNQRSTKAFLNMVDILRSAQPEHPVTQGVLLYLSTLPRWSGPDKKAASVMDIAALAWPRHKAAAASSASLFDDAEEQIRQFAVMASRGTAEVAQPSTQSMTIS